MINISAHILNHLVDDGWANQVFEETTLFVQRTRASYSSTVYKVFVGFDAHVQFPARRGPLTGDAVMVPRMSHSPAEVSVAGGTLDDFGVRLMDA